MYRLSGKGTDSGKGGLRGGKSGGEDRTPEERTDLVKPAVIRYWGRTAAPSNETSVTSL